MSDDTVLLHVPLCEPARPDIKAFNACEFVLEQLAKQDNVSEAQFKEWVVQWLAAKYVRNWP